MTHAGSKTMADRLHPFRCHRSLWNNTSFTAFQPCPFCGTTVSTTFSLGAIRGISVDKVQIYADLEDPPVA